MMIVKVSLIFPSPFTWENVSAGLNGKSAKQRELTLTRNWKEKQRPFEGISQGRKQRRKERKNRKPKEIEKNEEKKGKGKDNTLLWKDVRADARTLHYGLEQTKIGT